jgi:hypothetical protein
MGWCFGWQTRKGLINHLTDHRSHSKPNGDETVFTTLARCFIGNIKRKGTLWAVQQSAYRIGQHGEWQLGQPFIIAYLLDYGGSKHEWGYKDVEESMGPLETNCPLAYLDMAPAESPEWRERVRAYAAEKRDIRIAKRKRREAYRRTT